MDIDALNAFIAVATAESFSVAAQQLHLTQPAVSKRIAALESRLNHALFDRLGKRVALTQAGEALLPNAIRILQNIRDTEREIKELSGEIMGSLSVATSHHIGLHHLPPVLRAFVARHKNVNLKFEFLDSEHAHSRIIHGECELAIVTLAPKLEAPLQAQALWHDPLEFVVSRHHPLANSGKISLAELSKLPAILPDLNTYTGRLVKGCFDNAGLPLQLNMATNYLETVKMIVSVGLGWSVLPRTLIDENLIKLVVPGVTLSRSLGVINHQKRTLGNAARAFYAVLEQHANGDH
ncbi:MAG: DNA-binding transcriptional LysR family regulator [Lentisphaeria bacterium]|jgi:DNA-binding transcriptional LysR family regulator